MGALLRLAAASGRRRTIRVRPLTDATSTVSPGAKVSVAAGLPAFAISAHVACPSPPVEDLGRQAVHRPRADARRPAAGAPEHAADEDDKCEDQHGGETDDCRRQVEAGRLNLE